MKHRTPLLLITSFFFSLFMSGQELVSTSSLTGTELPFNTKKETKSKVLSTYINRMDSFAVKNSFKVDKNSVEMLYTDADSLFNGFTNKGWTVTPIAETNFYDITKNNTLLLAYVDYNMVLALNKTTGGAAKTKKFFYKKASVIIIKKKLK